MSRSTRRGCGRCRRRAAPGAAALLALLALFIGAAPAGAQTPESSEGIAAGTHYVLIMPEAGGFRVAETVELRNATAAAVDGLILPLFAGSWDVRLIDGFDDAQVNLVAGAVEVVRSLAPGERATFTLAYRLTAGTLPLSLTRPFVYPTDRLVVLAPVDAPFALLAEGLSPQGAGTFSGQEVTIYDAGAVAPVQEWVLGLAPDGAAPWQDAGVAVVDANRSLQGAWRPVVLGFGLMALWASVLQGSAAVRRRGLRLPRLEAWMEEAHSLEPAERRRLAAEVAAAAAALERAHRDRRVPVGVYRRQREALLAAWKHLHPDEGPDDDPADGSGGGVTGS